MEWFTLDDIEPEQYGFYYIVRFNHPLLLPRAIGKYLITSEMSKASIEDALESVLCYGKIDEAFTPTLYTIMIKSIKNKTNNFQKKLDKLLILKNIKDIIE